jgi:hypothetical protein
VSADRRKRINMKKFDNPASLGCVNARKQEFDHMQIGVPVCTVDGIAVRR